MLNTPLHVIDEMDWCEVRAWHVEALRIFKAHR